MSATVGIRYVRQVSPLLVARTPGGVGVPVASVGAHVGTLAVGDKVQAAVDGRSVHVLGKVA